MPLPSVTLYACSPCDLACQECIMQHHMGHDPKYQMSLDEVDRFCQVIESSMYRVAVTLSGGEPLVWRNLNDAAARLRECKAVQRLIMFTNAIQHARMTDATIRLFNKIRCSDYGHNATAVADLRRRAVRLRRSNVVRVSKFGFWRNPREPVPAELAHPVECMNPEVLVYNQRVYACPHALSISRVLQQPPDPESLSVSLAPGFMLALRAARIKPSYHAEICRRCISNGKVRRLLQQQDVNVSGTKQPELHQLKGLRPPAQEPWK